MNEEVLERWNVLGGGGEESGDAGESQQRGSDRRAGKTTDAATSDGIALRVTSEREETPTRK